jgi:hypothetical protein
MLQLLLTIPEAAELIGVGMSTLYELIAPCDVSTVERDANRRVPLWAAYDYVDRLHRETSPRLLVRALVDYQRSQS